MPAARKTILVVDDDEAVRDSLAALLELEFSVKTFASCQDFLESAPGDAICLILDVHLPGMGGLDLLEALKRRKVWLPAVLITGRCDDSIRKRAKALGAAALLEKPVSFEELKSAIARCG